LLRIEQTILRLGQGQKSKVFYIPTRSETMNCIYRASEVPVSNPSQRGSPLSPLLASRKRARASLSQRCPGAPAPSRGRRAAGNEPRPWRSARPPSPQPG